MKKLLSATLAVALVFGASSALAQTMSIGAGPLGGAPQPWFDVGLGQQFDVVVSLVVNDPSSAAEFVATELLLVAPGVFKLNTAKINNTPLDLGDNGRGEYILSFSGCFPGGQLPLVRVTYGTFSGPVPVDTVMTLRGFQEGDSQPSSFNGALGFVDCTDVKFTASLGGTEGGVTGSGVVFPDGGCVINGTPLVVDNEAGSMGQLKARF
jgi:hypothetical protein